MVITLFLNFADTLNISEMFLFLDLVSFLSILSAFFDLAFTNDAFKKTNVLLCFATD